jgi:predicted DNA binding CopG/RHH family protein
MKKSNKRIPKFKNEDKERKFWATHSPLDYFDMSKAKKVVFQNLKPLVKSISIRLPEHMLETVKLLANKRDVPYQFLLKMFLAEGIQAELQHSAKA